MAIKVDMRLEQAAASDAGRVRPRNEDRYYANSALGLFAVADGMGGSRDGLLASEGAHAVIEEFAGESTAIDWSQGEAVLHGLFAAINRRILRDSGDHPGAGSAPGTTLSLLAIHGTGYWIAHIGDSRVYLFRHGGVRQLTCDHTLVEEMAHVGQIARKDAGSHPLRHVLTRFLGDFRPIHPQIVQGRAQPGDLFLLATDGLTEYVREDELAGIVGDAMPLSALPGRLITLANQRGGGDNITVVAVRTRESTSEPRSRPR